MIQKHLIACVLSGLFCLVPAGPASAQRTSDTSSDMTDTMKMQKAAEYPRAGIILAIPTGFSISPQLWGEYQIMLASRSEGMQAAQSLSLEAYPADDSITPEQVLERLRKPLEDSLAVQKLKVEKTEKVLVAGAEGQAVHMSYTFRGIQTVTVSLCFIRDISKAVAPNTSGSQSLPAKTKLAYVLTLEVAKSHEKTMGQTFQAVLRTIFLSPVHRPIDLPVEYEGVYLRDLPQGYALRLPVGWIGGQNSLGVYLAQTDYILGGVPCPSVQVVTNLVDPSMTAEACGQKALQQMEKQGVKVEILSKGPAKLAKRDGFQYVIRKTQSAATQPASAPAQEPNTPAAAPASAPAEEITTLEIHRLLCVASNEDDYEERTRSYVLIVAGSDVTVEQLTELADQLAQQFIVTPARKE